MSYDITSSIPNNSRESVFTLFRDGRFSEAEAVCRRQLSTDPDNVELLRMLGILALRSGNNAEAVDMMGRVAAVKPDALTFGLLGEAYCGLDRFDEAEECCRRSLELKPDLPEVHNHLAAILRHKGRLAEAEAACREALRFDPQNAETYFNLAVVLKDRERPEEALACYARAAELKPDFPQVYYNLGNLLKHLKKNREAAAAYLRALSLKPDYGEAKINLGVVLEELGKPEEALELYREALRLDPGSVEAHNNLANALKELGRTEEAVETYLRAIELKPDYGTAYNNLCVVLEELGRVDEAQEHYRRALEVNPHFAAGRLHLAMMTLPIIVSSKEEADLSEARFADALDELEEFAEAEGWAEVGEAIGSAQPFYLAYRPGDHRELLSRYGDIACRARQAWAERRFPEGTTELPTAPRQRVRMVIVSGQVRRHSVWDMLLKGLVQYLDRNRFETILYFTSSIRDAETPVAATLVDRFIEGREDWMEEIRRDQPDVIFYPEVCMDTPTLRLASLRLAPLQIASWGHPVTTGLPTIDLYLSGELIEREDADADYREKLVRLPGTGACTARMPFAPIPLEPGDVDLDPDPNVVNFLICQQVMKFDPAHDGLYARIARECGPCRFWFVSDQKFPWAFDMVQGRIARTFEAAGLDPKEYLRSVPWLPGQKFWSLLEAMDLYLDTPAFSGYTTAWQASHRGLPVVTMEGKYMRQRLAAGLLRQIGITETIAADIDDYVQKAVDLALDRERRESLRERLRVAAPLADEDKSVVRAFEKAVLDGLAERGRLTAQEAAFLSNPIWSLENMKLHMQTLDPGFAPAGLFELINSAPQRVLDVGCFCGGSGKLLKERYPGCEIVGIEPLEEAAVKAGEILDRVIVKPLEQIDFEAEGLVPGSFDTVITADVLEHMINPWLALERLSFLVAPHGALYASIPNVRNLRVMLSLSEGTWRYEGRGILDFTHLRFFTRTQIFEMFEETGWTVDEIRVNPDLGIMKEFEGRDLATIKTIEIGNLVLKELTHRDILELLAYQYFVRARCTRRG